VSGLRIVDDVFESCDFSVGIIWFDVDVDDKEVEGSALEVGDVGFSFEYIIMIRVEIANVQIIDARIIVVVRVLFFARCPAAAFARDGAVCSDCLIARCCVRGMVVDTLEVYGYGLEA